LLFFEKRKASYFVTYRLQIYELIFSLFPFSQILIDAKGEIYNLLLFLVPILAKTPVFAYFLYKHPLFGNLFVYLHPNNK